MKFRDLLLSAVPRMPDPPPTTPAPPPAATPTPPAGGEQPAQQTTTSTPSQPGQAGATGDGTLAGGAAPAGAGSAGADQSTKPAATLAGGTDDPAGGSDSGAAAGDASNQDGAADATDLGGQPLPATYEIKAPDGFVMNDGLNAIAQTEFKTARLNPAQAQAMADAYGKLKGEETKQWLDTVNKWADETRADKFMTTSVEGGFNQNLGYVRKAVAEFGDDDFRKVLNDYGVGNHPAVNRFLAKVGRSFGEGGTPKGETGNSAQETSTAQLLYGPKA